MNKKLPIVLLGTILLFCIRGQCQTVMPATFNVAGGFYESNTSYMKLEWSLGEAALIDYYKSPDSSLAFTNGVLQPCTEVVTRSPLNIILFPGFEYRLFPNVTSGAFELDFFIKLAGHMDLQLTDAMGRVIDKRSYKYRCCGSIERYDISKFSNGVYFIHATFRPDESVYGEQQAIRQSSFRVVKIN